MFSFFLSSFLPIIIYIYIIIKRIKQKGMIKNKICQLDNSYLKKTGIIQDNRHFLITYLKKVIDTLHKEGKSQRIITERCGSSQSAVSKHIQCKVDWVEEFG